MKQSITIILTFFSLLLLSGVVFAEVGWEKSMDLNLNVTQSSYSDSWVGGEAGNVTWVSNANGIFAKQMSPKFHLKNSIKLSFGQTVSQDKDTKKWSKPAKSTDEIDLEALGRLTIQSFIEPYVAMRFESQFLDTRDDPNKHYINPALLTLSAGGAKQLLKKDKDEVLTRLGFALKENFDYGRKTTSDGGIESVSDAKLVLSDKLGYLGKLTLYKALFYSEKDKVAGMVYEDYWKAIDISWKNTLTAAVSKYIQVSFYLELQYDKQISLKGRLKETLALGVTYKMF